MDYIPEDNEPVTLDTLAGMVQRGFEKMATKADLAMFKQETADNFTRVNARLAAIEKNTENLITREEFDDLMARVKLLENRAGIVSGK